MRRFFDPKRYRIVLFDQRGCGKSTPHASLERQHHLGPRRRHREAARAPRHRPLAGVRRLVGLDARARLRADASRARHRARPARHLPAAPVGARLVLPERARRRCSRTSGRTTSRRFPQAERGDLIAAYYQRLTSDDRAKRCARPHVAWSVWEGATSYLRMNADYVDASSAKTRHSPRRSRASSATTS